MAKPVECNVDTFAREVLEEAMPVVVDFWSHTCPHCLRLNPEFEAAAVSEDCPAKFVKVSVQDAMPLFGQHRVSTVPTLVLFRGGQELARQSGARTKDEILAWLKEHLA